MTTLEVLDEQGIAEFWAVQRLKQRSYLLAQLPAGGKGIKVAAVAEKDLPTAPNDLPVVMGQQVSAHDSLMQGTQIAFTRLNYLWLAYSNARTGPSRLAREIAKALHNQSDVVSVGEENGTQKLWYVSCVRNAPHSMAAGELGGLVYASGGNFEIRVHDHVP